MTLKRLIFLFICGLFLVATSLSAIANDNSYQFAHIDKSNGLIHNKVNAILNDSRGFMWFGTADGLSKWDGYQFTNYTSAEDYGYPKLFNINVSNLQEDADGYIWIKIAGGYLVYDEQQECLRKCQIDTCTGFPVSEYIEDIYIDNKKNMFIITSGNHLLFREKGTSWLKNIEISIPENDHPIAIKGNGNHYWILYKSGLLQQFDLKTFSITNEITELRDRYSSSYEFLHYIDNEGDVWVYSSNPTIIGLWRFIPGESKWIIYDTHSRIPLLVNEVSSITQDKNGLIWIGTDHGGVHVFDKHLDEIHYILNNTEDKRSLCHNSITNIYCDSKGIIWVGTFKKGVDYYHKSICKFTRIGSQKTDNYPALPFEDIHCFIEDNNHNIWIGTNGGGLLYYNTHNKQIKVYKHDPKNPNSISSNIIISLSFDKHHRLWISTWLGGLSCYDGNKFTNYKHNNQDPLSLPVNSVWCTLNDTHNNLWVATFKGGICRYDGNGIFTPISQIFKEGKMGNTFTTSLIQIEDNLIMAGNSSGLYYLDLAQSKIIRIDESRHYSISPINDITSLYKDSRGLIWISSDNGLHLFDRQADTFSTFCTKDGLSNNSVKGITEDENHNIWISSLNGLSCISVNTNHAGNYIYTFENFTSSDGLQSDEFNQKSIYRCKNNEIWFGGAQGISIYKPNNVLYNASLPYPKFTDFQLSGVSVMPGDTINDRILLSKSISEVQDITLKYTEKNFTIYFSALSFLQPEKIKYRYRLIHFNNEWIEISGKAHQATYTNLSPGQYRLEVIASNSDGAWNAIPAVLNLTVLPPFWQTWIAYVFYSILFILLAFFGLQFIQNRIKRTANEQRIKNKHDMDEMKLRFFTNISHEFRTPLSLIISPCESMLKENRTEEDAVRLHIMERNAHQLLDLVNKLLDFRKLDKNAHTLNAHVKDIILCIQDICKSFSEMAHNRGIYYTYSSTVKSLFMSFDEEKIDSIMLNLLSNAFKFTSKNGHIKIKIDVINDVPKNARLILQVSDSGIGIRPQDIDKIFDRFYQASLPNGISNNGSGVGLNLVKEFVTLHNGTISVESIEKQGTTFTVQLPIIENDLQIEKDTTQEISLISVNEKYEKEYDTDENHIPLILVVDDNDDFRQFICSSLMKNFQTEGAVNGVDALEKISNHRPDLIISDVMMPEMDGLELCQRIRNNKDLSQTPIILLTAKSSEENKIEGFETGTDYYITKPFKMEILMLHINKLLERTTTSDAHIELKTSSVNIRSLDEQLVEKAVEIVERRMEDSNFSVEELSKELSMSRVHLYKKLLTLTGKSPIEFIRIVRLRRAAQLLEKSQLTVAEIAYQVGFNNPKYFSRHFKDEYGMLPSEYVKKSNLKN